MFDELSSKTVKVRKRRMCVWCGERIEVGESAVSRAYTLGGDFQSDYVHPECAAAMPFAEIYDNVFDEGDYARGTTAEHGTVVLANAASQEGG